MKRILKEILWGSRILIEMPIRIALAILFLVVVLGFKTGSALKDLWDRF